MQYQVYPLRLREGSRDFLIRCSSRLTLKSGGLGSWFAELAFTSSEFYAWLYPILSKHAEGEREHIDSSDGQERVRPVLLSATSPPDYSDRNRCVSNMCERS